MLSARFVASMYSTIVIFLGGGAASAQDYPNKPIRIITAAAGGSSDAAARVIAQGATDSLKQPVIVDNRTNVIAADVVSKSPPDGYTLMVSSESLWIRPLLEKVPYDVMRDFKPVGQLTREVYVVAVHPSLPAKSVKELVALAKAKPGVLNYGSATVGSGTHLAAALFTSLAGVNIVQVPYKGVAQSLTALVSGEVQLMFANPSIVTPHAKLGKLRTLAVTAPEPTVLAPGVPTVAASGVPGYEIVSLQGLFAPGKTPAAVINRLNQESVRVLNLPGVREKLLNLGAEIVGSSPQQFTVFITTDMGRLGKLIKDANIKAE